MRKCYTLIPHTADIAIAVETDFLESIYINSATALFDILVDFDNIEGSIEKELTIKGVDRDDLLIRLLNELLYIFSVDKISFYDFKITTLKDRELICIVRGGKIKSLDKIKNEIKAVTYSDFKIEEGKSYYRAKIVFDV